MANNKTLANTAGTDGVGIQLLWLATSQRHEGTQSRSRGKRKISTTKRLSSSPKPVLFLIIVI